MGIGGPPMRRAVFLDRDGVLNRAVRARRQALSARSVAELEILPGVAQALAALRRGGLPADRRHQPAGRRPRHA